MNNVADEICSKMSVAFLWARCLYPQISHPVSCQSNYDGLRTTCFIMFHLPRLNWNIKVTGKLTMMQMQDKNSSQALGRFCGDKYVYVLFFWVYLKWDYSNIGVVVRISLSEFPCGRPSRKIKKELQKKKYSRFPLPYMWSVLFSLIWSQFCVNPSIKIIINYNYSSISPTIKTEILWNSLSFHCSILVDSEIFGFVPKSAVLFLFIYFFSIIK